MPTIFSHAVAALGIGSLMLPRACSVKVWAAGAICSMLPDLDVVGLRFGVAYGDLLGHRGLSHSLLFAALLSVALALAPSADRWGISRLRLGLFLFFAVASHGFLDAFTNGGLGIAFLAPFDNERFFFPLRPIAVSPIGAAFFSERGLNVLKSELLWVWLPAAAMILLGLITHRRWHTR